MDNLVNTLESKNLPEHLDHGRKSDLFLVKLAREIAINHYTIDEIKQKYQIKPEEWQWISRNTRFHTILEAEIINWQSSTNTHERTKLKAAALMEEWMEEAAGRMYDKAENLPAKVELAKLITRIAGMGVDKMGIEGDSANKFAITINLGADSQLKFEKTLPSKVIQGEAVEM